MNNGIWLGTWSKLKFIKIFSQVGPKYAGKIKAFFSPWRRGQENDDEGRIKEHENKEGRRGNEKMIKKYVSTPFRGLQT